MKHVLALAFVWLVSLTARAAPPNIVLIFADDLGYGDLSCYGADRFDTPHLDRMAAQGVRFTNFYVPMPYCAPSRAAILTGRYPFRSGMVFNPSPDNGVNDIGLPASELTLAEVLRDRGYATTCIGKWHLGHRPEFYPTRHGFDSYLGILYSNDMRPVQLIEDDRIAEYPVVQSTLTKRYTQRALRFIESNRNRPFFLYLPHAMPHKPLAASDDFYMKTPDGLYADVIAELDWSVGQILAKLKELGLDDNTLVIFTSDNGPWYGGSTGGLRGMKSRAWEGGVRVRMMARWPGRIDAGREIREPAATIDLFPTVAKLAGAELPKGLKLDGRDIMPLLADPSARSPHEALFVMAGPTLAAVRSGPWKLYVPSPGPDTLFPADREWIDPRGPDGVTLLAPFEQPGVDQHPGIIGGDSPRPMMLFNLDKDRAEQRNVAAEHPQIVRRLKAHYDRIEAQLPNLPPPNYRAIKTPGPRPQR